MLHVNDIDSQTTSRNVILTIMTIMTVNMSVCLEFYHLQITVYIITVNLLHTYYDSGRSHHSRFPGKLHVKNLYMVH